MERKDVMDRAIRESVELHCHSVYSAKERRRRMTTPYVEE